LLHDDPGAIREVHKAYRDAGADVLITASYQATVEAFLRRGIALRRARELLVGSVALARDAGDGIVAASIGPYGAALADGSEYTGKYGLTEEELIAFHKERWGILAAAGADLLACETIPSAIEMRALARLLEETPGVRAWFSFSCRDGEHLNDGTLLRDCAAFLDGRERVAAIGVNCTAPRHVESLLKQAREATSRPLVAYPNSGENYDAVTGTWSGTADAEAFAAAAPAWKAAGAALIGGCCRTGPGYVRRLKEMLS
jgi:homocysteine S-methyltransferase